MNTVSSIREDIAPFVKDSGKCPDDPVVLKYLNSARRLLWSRGDFRGTVENVCMNSFCGHLTLPHRFSAIREAQEAGEAVTLDSVWYDYAPNTSFVSTQSCVGKLLDLGDNYASFFDYDKGRFRIRIMAESNLDEGKKIVFHATGEASDPKRITLTIGGDHEYVTADEYVNLFRHVVKSKTEGRILVYIFHPNNNYQKLCAIYEADDTSIKFRRYRVRGLRSSQFYLRLKKRYIPLLREEDEVEFDVDAIINACIALNARRNRDMAAYTSSLASAVEQANAELKDNKPLTGGFIRMAAPKVTNLIEY